MNREKLALRLMLFGAFCTGSSITMLSFQICPWIRGRKTYKIKNN